MRVAIVGAGFSGLAISYFLSSKCQVTLFDQKGVGGGASGVSSGLLHPYPAADGKRSFKADLALQEVKALLEKLQPLSPTPLFRKGGLLRRVWTEDQCNRFKSHIENYKDVEQCEENLFLIHSALTLYVPRYLETLWKASAQNGAELVIRKVESLEELREFDHLVLAAGWGMKNFPECKDLGIHFVKGQKLICRTKNGEKLQSVMSKKYRAVLEEEGAFEIGSTYERGFVSDAPDLESALQQLQMAFDEFSEEREIVECRAAVRVCRSVGYLPVAETLNPRCTVLTGMGSRGLLYHAYYGKMVAQSCLIRGLSE